MQLLDIFVNLKLTYLRSRFLSQFKNSLFWTQKFQFLIFQNVCSSPLAKSWIINYHLQVPAVWFLQALVRHSAHLRFRHSIRSAQSQKCSGPLSATQCTFHTVRCFFLYYFGKASKSKIGQNGRSFSRYILMFRKKMSFSFQSDSGWTTEILRRHQRS